MKSVAAAVLLAGLAVSLPAEPSVLVNLTSGRPVLSLAAAGGVVTTDLRPGTRRSFEASGLSGSGEKNLVLEAGRVYYWARFGALPRWYVLGDGQILAVNRSGRALAVSLPDGTAGWLAAGAPVLADSSFENPLVLTWKGPDGLEVPSSLAPGLYEWAADGEAAVLRPWSED